MSRILRVLISLLLLIFSQGISAYAQSPQAGFMAEDTVVCVNNIITFTDTSIIGSDSIATWEWTFGDGGTSTLQHPAYFYSAGGQYAITLIVTDSAGQKDTASSIIWVLSARAVQNIVRICSPATSATISAFSAVGPGVTGTWFTASSGVIATPLDTTTLVTGLVSGSYIFFWVVSDGFCSAADQVTVIVDQPIAATAGPDQNICSLTGTATLAGNNPAPGTGLWTTTSSATITIPTLRNTTVTGLTTAGTYTFVWTVTRGACVNSDTMQIVVSPPVTPNAGSDLQSCSNNPLATLTGSNPAPGSALWTTTGSASIATPTSSTTNVSALTAGVNTFIYTVTNGACVLRDTVLVTVITIATANAGTDRQVCTSAGTTSVTGSAPGTGTPSWSAVSIGNIVTPNAVTTSITGLTTPGFYSFVYTITNGVCVSRDTMVVIVRAPVVANAGTDQTLCAATTATLAGNSAAPGTGLWTTTGSAVITTPSSSTSGVSNLASGNNTFIWTATYGACVTRDTVIIRVDTTITANAGADQQICQTITSVTLTANNPSPGTGLWTRTNGGTITNPASSTTTITALTPGVHGFIWTITNGTCVTRDTLFVTVSTQIPSNAGLDQSICQGTTTSLSGNIPTPGTGLWSTSSAATITTPTSPTSAVSGFTTAGNYDFIWTVTNGACVLRDTVRITVDAAITANAGSDQTFCAATTATLAGNAAVPGTGLWSTAGSATITTPAFPTSGVTGLVTGNNTFIWTITNGQCVRRDTVNIIVNAPVTANAGSDQQICATTGSVALTGNSPAPGAALWTTNSTATIATPTTASTTVSGLSTAGTYTFVYTITNGICISRDTIIITVSNQVLANAGSDQAQCAITTATLAGNAAALGSGLWTTTGSATITTPASPTSAVSNLATGNNTFIWTITNGACVSRDTVVIRVDNPVVANAGFDQQICASSGSAIVFGNSPTPGSSLWTTATSATIVSPAATATAVTGLTIAGNYAFVYTITNGTCVRRDTVVVVVDSLVTANAGTNQLLCATTVTTLGANAATPGTGTWTTTGFATIVDPNSETSGVADLAIGNNVFIWEITNGACLTEDTVIVRVDSALTAIAGADQQICATSGSVALSGNNASPGTSLWTTSGSAVIADPTSASTTASGMNTAGTYTFVYTITNGTCVGSDTIVITVDNNVIANAGTDQSQCSLTTATLAANTALPGSGIWTSTGSAIIATPTSENSGVSNLSTGDNTFIWTITNGACVSTDTIIVRVDSLIAADAGTDQSLCISNTITLNAVIPSQGSGIWTALNGGTLSDSSQANTTVAGLTTNGTFNFVWTVTNGGCVSTDTVTFNVSQIPVADAGSDQFVSSGTLVNLGGSPTAVSGIAPFVYAWTPGTLVSDSVIANPTHIANATQTFVITLTDSTGCSATDFVTIYLNNAPVAVNDTAYLCMDGILLATVSANDYDIDGDSLSLSIFTPPVTGVAVISSTGVITYTPVNGPAYVDSLAYVICDNNPAISLCDTAWLFINVMSLPAVTSTATGILCFGDTIGGVDITVTNGATPYVYVWSTTDTTEDILGVPAGIYTVNVTDSMGCMASHTDTVSGPTAALLAQSILQNVNCHGDSTGAIDLSVSGGTTGYQFTWSTADTTEDLTGIPAGAYAVLVTDSNGCTVSLNDTILQPDSALAGVLTITDVKCASDTNGVAIIVISGGTPNYSYVWSNGSLADTLTALQTGIYSVTITDANGCTAAYVDTVSSINPAILITGVNINPFCLGGIYGSVTALATGGTSPYSYSWNNGDTINVADSLTAGAYDLMVTDSVGCIAMYNTVLNDSSSIAIALNDSVLCAGDSTVLSVPVYPGVQYQWYFNGSPLNGDTLNIYTAIAAGSYSLNATASCGLFIASPVNIQVDLLPTADAGSDQSVKCDQVVAISATGGDIYSWSPAGLFANPDTSTTTLTTDNTTFLVVTVTDTNGCSAKDSLLLTVECEPFTIPSGFSPNNDGVNDFFVITAVNRYPGSLLRVYSRWGSLVYEKAFYDNSWNGFSNMDMTLGEELPDGTYYYVFDPKDGSELLKGYVIIRRQ
jgi:gliding motility-associated-like protein